MVTAAAFSMPIPAGTETWNIAAPLASVLKNVGLLSRHRHLQEDARAQFELALAIDEVHHLNGVSSEAGIPQR